MHPGGCTRSDEHLVPRSVATQPAAWSDAIHICAVADAAPRSNRTANPISSVGTFEQPPGNEQCQLVLHKAAERLLTHVLKQKATFWTTA